MQNILKGKYGVHSHSSIIGRQKTVNVYSCFLKLVIIRVARSSIKCLLCFQPVNIGQMILCMYILLYYVPGVCC